MKRGLAAVALSVVALVGTTLPSAHPDTTTVNKRIFVDSATMGGVWLDAVGCGSDPFTIGTGYGLTIHNTGLDSVNAPSAQRYWQVQTPSSTPSSGGPLVWPTSSLDLTVLQADIKASVSGVSTGQAVIYYWNSDGSGWIGRAALSVNAVNAGDWTQVSAGDLAYNWMGFGANGAATGATDNGRTIQQFATDRGGQPALGWNAAIEFGCDGHSFGIQNVTWGSTPGSLVHEDYESLTNNVASKPSASFVATGSAMTLGGSSQYGGPATATVSFRDATMNSYASANSSVSATSLLNLSCNSTGSVCRNPFAGVVLHPKYNVTYRWCYGSTVEVDATCNTFGTIHVQATIAATFPSSISAGQRFTVSGKVAPLRPGTLVGLWGKRGTTTTRIGVATVTSAGTYSINASVGSGSWTLWLTTANDKLNAAGKSVSKAYTVR